MINVALLSKWHVHAADYAREAIQNPSIRIIKVWDELPERGSSWAQDLNVPYESDLSAIFSDLEIDAVIVNAPTTLHRDIIVEAAQAGKHIFTEKVLAVTTQEGTDILNTLKAANVKFMISLPRLTDPYYLYAQHVVDQHMLGDLTMIRCRVEHDGAVPYEGHPHGWLPRSFFNAVETGGGALIDLGAHPIYLTNRLAGPAKALSALLSSYFHHGVDDNSAVIVEYESGAIGVLETSFVSGGGPLTLELHGTWGSFITNGRETRIKSKCFSTSGWVIVDKLPAKLPSPMEQWVREIEAGEQPYITHEDAWRLTQINEAAALSHRANRKIYMNELDITNNYQNEGPVTET
jgi:scyllo-inositol 2-dehydrogenase (NAD+)